MRMTWLAVVVAVVCIGAWTVSAQTQQDQQAQQHSQQGQESMQGMGSSQGGMGQHPAPGLMASPSDMQIQGKVLSYKDVNVTNDKEHRVVRIQTRTGQTMDVDLGRKNQLPKGLEINEGQWVIVTGVQGKLDNNNVLVAHNLANVYNFEAGGGVEPGGTGGTSGKDVSKDIKKDYSKDKDKASDSDTSGTRAQYKDYPGHVGSSGNDGAQQQQQNSSQDRE